MFGSDENARMGYIDPRQGTETCGFAEQMTSDGILARITGDPLWADNCEDVLFNSFPAAFTTDMKALRYITCPNGVTADDQNHSPGIANAGPFLLMNPFSSRCCQHNHGPLTFSLKVDENYKEINSAESAIWDSKWQETADPTKWPSYEIDPDSPWNYGLIINKENPEESFTLIRKEFPENNYPFSVEDVPLELEAKGRRIPSWGIDQYGLVDVLPLYPVKTNQPVQDITLIPMGAARLRISAFPVVEMPEKEKL